MAEWLFGEEDEVNDDWRTTHTDSVRLRLLMPKLLELVARIIDFFGLAFTYERKKTRDTIRIVYSNSVS